MLQLLNTFRRATTILTILCAISLLSACKAGFGRSGNADLESLSLSRVIDGEKSSVTLSPVFKADVTEYTVEIGRNVAQIGVTAKLESDKANMRVNGNAVADGEETLISIDPLETSLELRIVVTAENEGTKTYVVEVEIEDTSTDATLSSLSLDNLGFSQVFAAGSTEYTASSSYFLTETKVTMERSSEQSSVVLRDGTDEALTDNEPSDAVSLTAGSEKLVRVVVTAGDNSTTETYEIRLERDSAVNQSGLVSPLLKPSNVGADHRYGSLLVGNENGIVVSAPGDADNELYYLTQASERGVSQNIERSATSISMSGTSIAVGLSAESGQSGQVTLFETPTNSSRLNEVQAFPLTGEENIDASYGASVSILGGYLAIGSPATNNVFVYRKSNNNWARMSNQPQLGDSDTAIEFGASLAFNPDSAELELVVGAPGDSETEGAVFVFQLDGNTWTRVAQFTSADGEAGDQFGASVAIYGDTIAVGAPEEDASSTEAVSDSPALGNESAGNGAVFVYRRDGNAFTNTSTLSYLKAGVSGDLAFGAALAVLPNMVVVGAPEFDEGASEAGAIFVFEYSAGAWSRVGGEYRSTSPVANDNFGAALGFVGDKLFIGAPGRNSGEVGAVGAFFVLEATD